MSSVVADDATRILAFARDDRRLSQPINYRSSAFCGTGDRRRSDRVRRSDPLAAGVVAEVDVAVGDAAVIVELVI